MLQYSYIIEWTICSTNACTCGSIILLAVQFPVPKLAFHPPIRQQHRVATYGWHSLDHTAKLRFILPLPLLCCHHFMSTLVHIHNTTAMALPWAVSGLVWARTWCSHVQACHPASDASRAVGVCFHGTRRLCLVCAWCPQNPTPTPMGYDGGKIIVRI